MNRLQVKVGDEVTVLVGGEVERIVRVTNITKSGLIDAAGRRWNRDGSYRGERPAFYIKREIAPTTPDHRNERDAVEKAKDCTRIAYSLSGENGRALAKALSADALDKLHHHLSTALAALKPGGQ